MRTRLRNLGVAAGLAGALAFGGLAPATAASVPTSTSVVKASQPDHVDQVRWRGGWGAGPFVAGAALGLLGATAAYGAWGPGYGYYGAPYAYYGAPYYYPSYSYVSYPYYYGPRRYWGPRPFYGHRVVRYHRHARFHRHRW
jgi:hypothetical protein